MPVEKSLAIRALQKRRQPALSTFHLAARGIPLLSGKKCRIEETMLGEKLGVGHRARGLRAVQVHDGMDSPRLFVICSGERKRNTISRRERKEFIMRSANCAPGTNKRSIEKRK